MTERSGIEMIEEILVKLENIEQRLGVLEFNLKNMNNSIKFLELFKKSNADKVEGWSNIQKPIEKTEQSAGFKNFKFESSAPQEKKTIVVKGKMVAQAGQKTIPLPNILVKIFDNKDVLIKETRTNRAGSWVSHLFPGKYIAIFEGEFNGKKIGQQTRNFIVPDTLPPGQSEFEVI